jgi:hypothetical protein
MITFFGSLCLRAGKFSKSPLFPEKEIDIAAEDYDYERLDSDEESSSEAKSSEQVDDPEIAEKLKSLANNCTGWCKIQDRSWYVTSLVFTAGYRYGTKTCPLYCFASTNC